MLKFADLRC